MRKEWDLSGKKFGKLTVLNENEVRVYGGTKARFWKCRCECGNEKFLPAMHLGPTRTKSCGCLQKRRGSKHPNWQGHGEIPISIWNGIKNGCKRKTRDLCFDITIEYAWKLFLNQERKCALSGVELKFEGHVNDFKNTSASLDRIDSNKGYVKGNVQWVHKKVQIMKWNLDQDEFIKFCKLVAKVNE